MKAVTTQLGQVLHMNQGNGETSYARNSAVGRKAMSIAKPVIEEAVLKILGSDVMGIESMGIADLGCSSGPNTFLLISHIINGSESILEPHFGKEMMDDLFQKYAEEVSKHLSSCVTRPKYTVLVISLLREI
ncbi:hypothetical protein ACLB2K_038986 [Fragaria x ananassa]